VRDCAKVRVFGSGHSFNEGNVSDEVLISLDNYSGLVSKDPANCQITVRGGTRVRDVVKLLAQDGLAFAALPSHDAQSIAGILATDVHGSGRDWGLVSSSVVRLKLLDGNAELIMCEPADDLFRAVIGGIGAVGMILEVTVQGIPRFNISQRVDICALEEVRRSLDMLIATNDHFSLYLFPFTGQCQVNTWNHTDRPHSRNADIREFCNISLDALLAAWVGNILAYTKLLPLSGYWSRLSYLVRRGSNLVLESDCAYNRTIITCTKNLSSLFRTRRHSGCATASSSCIRTCTHRGCPTRYLRSDSHRQDTIARSLVPAENAVPPGSILSATTPTGSRYIMRPQYGSSKS
jgi:hypothetical protein